MTFPITDASPFRFADALAAPRRCGDHRRRRHRGDDRLVPAPEGSFGLLCEKGRIAGEQSSRNWGWVRQQGRDPGELPIMIESLSIWKRLSAEMGDGLGFRQTGVLYLAKTDREMKDFEAWTEHSRAHQLDTRLLTGAETLAMLKGAAPPGRARFTPPSDARAEPGWRSRRWPRGAGEGRLIRESCAVRGLDLAGGRVAGVVTEAGPGRLRPRCRRGRRLVTAVSRAPRREASRNLRSSPRSPRPNRCRRSFRATPPTTTSPSAAAPMAAIPSPPGGAA